MNNKKKNENYKKWKFPMDSLAPSRFFKCIFVSNNKKSQLHFPTFMPKIAIKKLRQNCTKRGGCI